MYGLSGKEKEVLDFLRAWFDRNETNPSLQDIATACGFSKARAGILMQSLIKKGYVERLEGTNAIKLKRK